MSPVSRSLQPTSLVVAELFLTVTAATAEELPVSRERALLLIIQSAGYDCAAIERIELAPSPPSERPGAESIRPETVIGKNGKRFLVTRGGRNPRPVVRPLPQEASLLIFVREPMTCARPRRTA